MSNNIVSVIIPAYNAMQTIEKALKSALIQTDVNIEIIVVNDGSIDNTEIILNNYERDFKNIKVIHQCNKGVASARNRGVLESTGDYIAFLDSDDEWHPNKLALQLEVLKELNGCNSFGLIATNFPGLGLKTENKEMVFEGVFKITFKCLLKKHYFQPSTVLMKRVVFNAVGGFKEGMTHAEEGLLFYKISSLYDCYIMDEILINYGDNKHPFLDSGLASNLLQMEKGELGNYREIYKLKIISFNKLCFLSVFSLLKFSRRLFIKLISKVRVNG